MSNVGLATRKKLSAVLHPDIHGDVTEAPASIFGYGDKEFRLPNRPFMPNLSSIGTPGEARRDRATQLERAYDRAFVVGAAIIVLLVTLGGYGYLSASSDSVRAQPPLPIQTGVHYRIKAAHLLPGKMLCELDQHEGCLVCMHKDASGMPVVSNHC